MPSGVALLVWNPLPRPVSQHIELEASLDYRPIWKYTKKVAELPLRVKASSGHELPFQLIDTEHHSMVDLAWRKRVVVPVELPAFGWNVIEMAYRDDVLPATIKTKVAAEANSIFNGIYRVVAAAGDAGIRIYRNGHNVFSGDDRLGVVTVEDPWGSWGGMAEEPASIDCSTVRHHWTVTAAEVLERGPLRATMWIKLEGGQSRTRARRFAQRRSRRGGCVGACFRQ